MERPGTELWVSATWHTSKGREVGRVTTLDGQAAVARCWTLRVTNYSSLREKESLREPMLFPSEEVACQRKYVGRRENIHFPIKALGPGLVPVGQVGQSQLEALVKLGLPILHPH